jgi:hypothetical protein
MEKVAPNFITRDEVVKLAALEFCFHLAAILQQSKDQELGSC